MPSISFIRKAKFSREPPSRLSFKAPQPEPGCMTQPLTTKVVRKVCVWFSRPYTGRQQQRRGLGMAVDSQQTASATGFLMVRVIDNIIPDPILEKQQKILSLFCKSSLRTCKFFRWENLQDIEIEFLLILSACHGMVVLIIIHYAERIPFHQK